MFYVVGFMLPICVLLAGWLFLMVKD